MNLVQAAQGGFISMSMRRAGGFYQKGFWAPGKGSRGTPKLPREITV